MKAFRLMVGLKAVRCCTIQVSVPEENWDTFEAAVLAAGRQYGTVRVTDKGMTTDGAWEVRRGNHVIVRHGLTVDAYRTELVNKDG